MTTAHLMFGYLGAGKTTLAKALEVRHGAVRFTPDDWMARLFGEDPPAPVFQAKAAEIRDLMEPIWTRCLSLNVDVVLDYGFWSRAERDRVREIVRSLGAQTVLHDVRCPDEEARRRVAWRNGTREQSLFIAPATFEALRHRVEPLGIDEERIEASSPFSGAA